MSASKSLDKKKIVIGAASVVALIAFCALAAFIFQDKDHWREVISGYLETARGTPWALPFVVATYVFGGFVLFPVTVLNLACALVFGLWGIIYALIGAVANAAVFFLIGRAIQKKWGEKLLAHPNIKKVDKKLNRAGVTGVVAVHLLPAPPYSIVNLAGGLTSVGFWVFMIGTLIVMLPGAVARGIVGDSLTKVFLDPTPQTYVYVGLGLLLWAGLIAATHFTAKKFQAN